MIALAKGELWTHRLAHGSLVVRCASGSVWLTREGEPADVVLDAGGSYRSGGSGLVVVEALDEARLSVSGPAPPETPARPWLVAAALLAVYVIWGSTYLAMRYGLESFPPFLMGGVRFVFAGAVLYAVLRRRGAPAPDRTEWWAAARTGVLLLAGGNGFVALGQQQVSSSLAAVVVTTMPLWAAVFAAVGGHRPSRGEWAGLAVGFAGACMQHAGGDLRGVDAGALVVVLAPICWALGSVWSRHLPLPAGPMSTAAQMLAGGVAMLLISVLRGERLSAMPSLLSVSAVLYLAVFGSIVAFTAYGYLLRKTRPAVATSYAYVNPLIAIALGVAIAGEGVAAGTWAAAAVIIGGVAILSVSARRKAKV